MSAQRRTAIAYFDGFNFYHGTVKKEPTLKWLDIEALSRALLRSHALLRVNYYTARLSDSPRDPTISQRQNTYLRALAAQPHTEVVLGRFARKEVWVDLPNAQRVKGRTWEEKGSDVNLGVDLVRDAARGAMSTALVFSNDTDLQRAADHAMEAGVEVVVVNPHHRTNRASLVGSDTRNLRRKHLIDSQLPTRIVLSDGVVLQPPADWT